MKGIVLKPDKLDFEYDKENDVLYISAGKPGEADDSIEPHEGVVYGPGKGSLLASLSSAYRSVSLHSLREKSDQPVNSHLRSLVSYSAFQRQG